MAEKRYMIRYSLGSSAFPDTRCGSDRLDLRGRPRCSWMVTNRIRECCKITFGQFRGTKRETEGELEVLGEVVDVVQVKFVPQKCWRLLYLYHRLQHIQVDKRL